jgi:hypothetical protein
MQELCCKGTSATAFIGLLNHAARGLWTTWQNRSTSRKVFGRVTLVVQGKDPVLVDTVRKFDETQDA